MVLCFFFIFLAHRDSKSSKYFDCAFAPNCVSFATLGKFIDAGSSMDTDVSSMDIGVSMDVPYQILRGLNNANARLTGQPTIDTTFKSQYRLIYK